MTSAQIDDEGRAAPIVRDRVEDPHLRRDLVDVHQFGLVIVEPDEGTERRLGVESDVGAAVFFQPMQQEPSDGRLADAALLGADDEQDRLDHRARGGGARGVV